MSIIELGALGEFVGSIGVVATLIYLAVQIRKNSKQLRLSSIQSANEKFAALITDTLQDPVKLEAFRDGLESYSSLQPGQQASFHSLVFNSMTAYRNNAELFHAGVLPSATLMLHEDETDPYGIRSTDINMCISNAVGDMDPIMGSWLLRGLPCRVSSRAEHNMHS